MSRSVTPASGSFHSESYMASTDIGKDSIDSVFETFQDTVGTTAKQLSTVERPLVSGARIKALAGNADVVYVGSSSGISVSQGYPLAAGEELPIPVSSLHKVWVIAGAASQGYAVFSI